MNGILLIDKPAGLTSHTVISKLRKKLGMKKIGHAGTLDPSATGLLVMCLGSATKISGYIMDLDKAYQTKFIFGKTTSTYDAEGEVTSEKDVSHLTQKMVEDVMSQFIGTIAQKPPIYSAIKIKGKKLYQYARSNTDVEIPTRNVTIHSIKLMDFKNPHASLEMHCTKGTYVRSLVHDLGQVLNVGASVESIHRIESAPFSIKDATSLHVLLEMPVEEIEKRLIPISNAISKKFKTIKVSDEEEFRIRRGIQFPKVNFVDQKYHPDDMILFVSSSSNQEVAIGRWGEDDRIQIKRVF